MTKLNYKTTTMNKAEVDAVTIMAIQQFSKVQKLETKLEKAETELTELVVQIPKDDISHYVAITNEMIN